MEKNAGTIGYTIFYDVDMINYSPTYAAVTSDDM